MNFPGSDSQRPTSTNFRGKDPKDNTNAKDIRAKPASKDKEVEVGKKLLRYQI